MLEPADHEPAGLGITGTALLGTKIDEAGLVGGYANLDIEASPALGGHFALERRLDLVLRLRAEFDRHEILGPGSQAAADVVA